MRSIKNFLLERGLIKIGSSCPNNVLRAMYENALMSGDLINTWYDKSGNSNNATGSNDASIYCDSGTSTTDISSNKPLILLAHLLDKSFNSDKKLSAGVT